MTNTNITPAQSVDQNKAIAAGSAALLGGAVMKILTRIINLRWPGFLDEGTTDALDTLVVGGIAYLGAYLIPHKST